jgi:hypothetical protein
MGIFIFRRSFLSNYNMQQPDILHIALSDSPISCKAILCSLLIYFLFTKYLDFYT